MAAVRNEICRLIQKYGPWGGVVATLSGKVIHCSQYALAASLTNTPLTVYGIPDDRGNDYAGLLNRQYGAFSYENIQRTTYIQTYAQLNRLNESRLNKKSKLYSLCVEPWLASQDQNLRGFDFGSGHGDYAGALRARGHNLLDLELFRRKGSGNQINLTEVNKMVDRLIESIKAHGQFDYVICDSVLNSVDCEAAEKAVLTMINILCKPGGRIFFSGRERKAVETDLKSSTKISDKRKIEFLDEKGFTALYRKGHWFFQKFHSDKQVDSIICDYGLKQVRRTRSGGCWRVESIKQVDLSWEAAAFAINYEFNLPIGKNISLGRTTDVLEAFSPIIQDS